MHISLLEHPRWVKAASELSLWGLILKEMVRGLQHCRVLLKVGKAHVGEGASASTSVLGVLTCRVMGGRPSAWGRGPTEDSGSFSGQAPHCLLGLDGHSAEAECSPVLGLHWGHSPAWGRLHLGDWGLLEDGGFLRYRSLL